MFPLSFAFIAKKDIYYFLSLQNGVEKGDVLVELCGEQVLPSVRGKVNFLNLAVVN